MSLYDAETRRLVETRIAAYASAFDALDIEAVKAWHSKDIVFNDTALDEYEMDATRCQTLLGEGFSAMKSLKVIESSTTGTAEFTTWEMLLEVVYGVDEPRMGIVKGDKAHVRGVSLLWWAWESADEWDGSLESDALRGWKIVREHDYMVTLKKGAKGGKLRLFGTR